MSLKEEMIDSVPIHVTPCFYVIQGIDNDVLILKEGVSVDIFLGLGTHWGNQEK